jgi:alpha-beta hydrolase superfamily lysophospholipase
LSDYFTRNGIAVLRYDDRGVGDSEGDFGDATSYEFAMTLVLLLHSKIKLDFSPIGLAGHSEGGLLRP